MIARQPFTSADIQAFLAARAGVNPSQGGVKLSHPPSGACPTCGHKPAVKRAIAFEQPPDDDENVVLDRLNHAHDGTCCVYSVRSEHVHTDKCCVRVIGNIEPR